MNALAGVAMSTIGLPDLVLWGALAFVLNYVNYVLILGPQIGYFIED